MAGGRPKQPTDLNSDDFKTESELQGYLVDNAQSWVNDFFGTGMADIKQSWSLSKFRPFGSNKPSIDIVVNTKCGKRIGIEVKNPKNIFNELSRTISQLMSYAVIAEENGNAFDELGIITSRYDDILIRVIKKYNLPIRVFVVNKNYHAEII